MPFELRIALRYLKARRKQAFISVISGVSMLGVAIGVCALMIAFGLMTGLQGEIRSRILGATAHLSLFASGSDGIDGYAEVAESVRRLPRVLGSAPAVYGKGLTSGPGGSFPVTVKGIDPKLETTVTELGAQVKEGSLAALEAPAEGAAPILLGHDLAQSMGVATGDVITIMSMAGKLSPLGMLPRRQSFRVAGTVRSGLWEFDSEWAYVSLSAAQRLFDLKDHASLVEVRVDDMYAVNEIGEQVVDALGPGYVSSNWIQMNQSLFAALKLEKIAIGVTIGLIVMVAALNIIATLILMVMEKHQDIAILVTMGTSRAMIARIFMLQGTLIGAAGTVVGSILGWTACYVLDRWKLIQVQADVYQVSYVPFKLQPDEAAVVIAGALLVCFLATIYPATGAARLDPAEALRYE